MGKLTNFTMHTIPVPMNGNIQINDKIEYIEVTNDVILNKKKGDIFIIENIHQSNVITVSIHVNDNTILTESINIKEVIKFIVGNNKLLKTAF